MSAAPSSLVLTAERASILYTATGLRTARTFGDIPTRLGKGRKKARLFFRAVKERLVVM